MSTLGSASYHRATCKGFFRWTIRNVARMREAQEQVLIILWPVLGLRNDTGRESEALLDVRFVMIPEEGESG